MLTTRVRGCRVLGARVARYSGSYAIEIPRKAHATEDQWDPREARECRGVEHSGVRRGREELRSSKFEGVEEAGT